MDENKSHANNSAHSHHESNESEFSSVHFKDGKRKFELTREKSSKKQMEKQHWKYNCYVLRLTNSPLDHHIPRSID